MKPNLARPDTVTSSRLRPGRTTHGPDLYAGLDFGWMKELLAFDHWSMMTAGPLRDGPTQSFMEAPIPNFVTLQNWAKLRLAKGLHEGDLASAT